MSLKTYRSLRIWQEAHALTLAVYKVTKAFPSDERFALVTQLKRSAASVGANIAESTGRRTRDDFCRFLYIAKGSAAETTYHLLLARDLGYVEADAADGLIARYDGLSAAIYRCIERAPTRSSA